MKTHEFEKISDWLKARRALGIGSTDAPAILGLSRFKSPFQLYHEKRKTVAELEPRYVEMAEWGRDLEDVIARRYSINTSREVVKTGNAPFVIQQHDDLEWMIASVDRYAIVSEAPPTDPDDEDDEDEDTKGVEKPLAPIGIRVVLELKNAHFVMKDKWGDLGEPPLEYLVQLQHQLAVTGMPWGSLAALVGGTEFKWADVQRNDEFIKQLIDLEEQFMRDVAAGNEPEPDGSESTKRMLKALYPTDDGTTIELPPEAADWANELEKAKADAKDAKARETAAGNLIRNALGTATMGTLRDGRAFTFKNQKTAGYMVKPREGRILRPKKG